MCRLLQYFVLSKHRTYHVKWKGRGFSSLNHAGRKQTRKQSCHHCSVSRCASAFTKSITSLADYRIGTLQHSCWTKLYILSESILAVVCPLSRFANNRLIELIGSELSWLIGR